MGAKRAVPSTLLSVLTSLCLMSCGAWTSLDTTWRDPLSPRVTFSKLAIIAMLKSPDLSQQFEIAVAGKYQKAGVDAVPGFSILRGRTDLTQDEMETLVRKSGADGVLLFKIIAVDSTESYVPPTSYATGPPGRWTSTPIDTLWWSDPVWGYYHAYPHHYWGYWYPAMQVVSTAGYWQTEDTDRVESALYRTSDGRLIWTALTSTYNPTGNYDLAASLSGPTLKRLARDGLIRTR